MIGQRHVLQIVTISKCVCRNRCYRIGQGRTGQLGVAESLTTNGLQALMESNLFQCTIQKCVSSNCRNRCRNINGSQIRTISEQVIRNLSNPGFKGHCSKSTSIERTRTGCSTASRSQAFGYLNGLQRYTILKSRSPQGFQPLGQVDLL